MTSQDSVQAASLATLLFTLARLFNVVSQLLCYYDYGRTMTRIVNYSDLVMFC